MAQAMCSSFKAELLIGTHNLTSDTFKIALYTSAATIGAATTAYTTAGEVVGTGYVAGGNTLTGAVVTQDGTVGICDFSDSTWAGSTITARYALIYNSTKADRAVAVLDFGSDKTSAGGDFTVVMPAPTATTAIIRIA